MSYTLHNVNKGLPTLMKSFLICLSTAKLTITRRLPNVVMTIQTAIETAMSTVSTMPNGAGQHDGPQSLHQGISDRHIIVHTH